MQTHLSGGQAAIEKDNVKGRQLRAVIETAPRESLVEIARGLDKQRQAGVSLSVGS